MAVYQTREYFFEKYGYLMDNPHVGEELAEKYWKPGNSRTFLELVQDLTGKPFSAAATVKLVNRTVSEALEQGHAMLEREQSLPRASGPVRLGAKIELLLARRTALRLRSWKRYSPIGSGSRLLPLEGLSLFANSLTLALPNPHA
jgi:hypothetical protein